MQEEPLRNLQQPILFLMGDSDKFCSLAEMRSMVATMTSPDIRLDLLEVNANLGKLLQIVCEFLGPSFISVHTLKEACFNSLLSSACS